MYRSRIEINVKDIVDTRFSNPTIYVFIDTDTRYSFKLHKDCASLTCLDTNEVLISGIMENYNGLCTWGELVEWAKTKGVLVNY